MRLPLALLVEPLLIELVAISPTLERLLRQGREINKGRFRGLVD